MQPVNETRGADPEIIRRLKAIRRFEGELPAFRRGQIVYDFDAGKVRIAFAYLGADINR